MRALLRGCRAGCSVTAAQTPPPPLAVLNRDTGEGERSPGGREGASAMLQHAKSRSA